MLSAGMATNARLTAVRQLVPLKFYVTERIMSVVLLVQCFTQEIAPMAGAMVEVTSDNADAGSSGT